MPEKKTRPSVNGQEAVRRRGILLAVGIALLCGVFIVLPTPAGLSEAGMRVMGVAALAILLWSTEALPMGVTSVLVIILLVISGGVSGFREALIGFAQPVPYFLIGVLTIGLAVSKSGLAERLARFLLGRCGGRPRTLYLQLLLAFPLLTLMLPSATTRTGILIHVYEEALTLGGVQRGAPLGKAIMMALSSINRIASTMLLTGGITPIVASALVGGISWSRWLVLMGLPYSVLLATGGGLIYGLYRRGFGARLPGVPPAASVRLSRVELRTTIIIMGTSALWLTDGLHHLHPALPALFAWMCLLAPGIGVITWRDFEQDLGWATFFVLAASLSLAQALIDSGAGSWIASLVVRSTPALKQHPLLAVVVLLVAATLIRLLIPTIAGFLAITIPVAMLIGTTLGLNPVVCGLLVMIAGDAVLYYPAQSASSLVVYEHGHLSAPEIFRFGLAMTLATYLVVLGFALPFWGAVGEPLLMRPRP